MIDEYGRRFADGLIALRMRQGNFKFALPNRITPSIMGN
jgi:hypothetical protein